MLDTIGAGWLMCDVGRIAHVSTVFTYKTIIRAVVGSFILAQAVIWAGEIRAIGIRKWLKDDMSKSYAKYFSLLSRTQRLRLIALWTLFLAVTILVIVLL